MVDNSINWIHAKSELFTLGHQSDRIVAIVYNYVISESVCFFQYYLYVRLILGGLH